MTALEQVPFSEAQREEVRRVLEVATPLAKLAHGALIPDLPAFPTGRLVRADGTSVTWETDADWPYLVGFSGDSIPLVAYRGITVPDSTASADAN